MNDQDTSTKGIPMKIASSIIVALFAVSAFANQPAAHAAAATKEVKAAATTAATSATTEVKEAAKTAETKVTTPVKKAKKKAAAAAEAAKTEEKKEEVKH